MAENPVLNLGLNTLTFTKVNFYAKFKRANLLVADPIKLIKLMNFVPSDFYFFTD